jgi:nitrous oxidase accessory protein NosD
MNRDVLSKSIVIGIVILFIGMSVVPSSGTKIDKITIISSNLSKTLYVGGSGPGNYSKIQDAIDNASEWDTVFVYNGTYFESIVIDKSMQVIGEDRHTTIIDGRGHEIVVEILTQDVLFEEFTVQYPTWDLRIGILIAGNFVRIYNNTIQRSVKGIQIMGDFCRIIGNNITKNIVGLIICVCSFNIIQRNNFIENIVHATFSTPFNIWDHNYWDKGIINNFKIIFGSIMYGSIPWVQFDRYPATNPYDI